MFVAICAAIYTIVKYIHDFRNGREGVKQNQQHTEQEKIATDEKALDLDSRRVKASEEVASEALENLAETREEMRQMIIENQDLLPYPIRMETDVDWLHIDVKDMDYKEKKIYLFKA